MLWLVMYCAAPHACMHTSKLAPCPCACTQVCRFLLDECRAAGMHMHMGCSPSAIVREPDGSLTVRLQPASKGGGGGSGSGVDSNSTGEIRGNEQVVLADRKSVV